MRKAIDVLAEDGCDLLRNHVRREVRYNLVVELNHWGGGGFRCVCVCL